MDEGEVRYQRVVHVLPEQRSGSEDVERHTVRSVISIVSKIQLQERLAVVLA